MLCHPLLRAIPGHICVEERSNAPGYLCAVRLERKMTGVQQMRLSVRQIATVWGRTLGGKDEVILTPHDQGRWLTLSEQGLKLRVQWHVRSVVIEKIHLNLPIAGAVQADLIQGPGCGIQ